MSNKVNIKSDLGRRLSGTLSSVMPGNTAVVTVYRVYTHKKYRKVVKAKKKYFCHLPDSFLEKGVDALLGRVVVISECRPLSKNKHFILESIV